MSRNGLPLFRQRYACFAGGQVLTIQLELALQASTARSVSAATPLETVADDEEDGNMPELDRPPRSPLRQLRAASAVPHSPTGRSSFELQPSPSHVKDRRRPASVQVRGSNYTPIGDTSFGQGDDRAGAMAKLLGQTAPKTPDIAAPTVWHPATPTSADDSLSRRQSLMKPGVGYRIRPKRYSMTSTSGRQSAASTNSHAENLVVASSHDKMPTTSTDDGELRTPNPSVIGLLGSRGSEAVVHVSASVEDGLLNAKDDGKDDVRRLSAISTATVTFGH